MRVGPSRDYKVSWVYRREQLPLKVLRVVDGWRLVQDSEGTQGWVSSSLLSPRLTALVVGEGLAPMRDAANANGGLKWNLEPGVVGYLGGCSDGWCELDVKGYRGWVSQSRLWGAGEP
ncbi:SH3 domain-containing protein [Pontixanthobacter gangjinensis]